MTTKKHKLIKNITLFISLIVFLSVLFSIIFIKNNEPIKRCVGYENGLRPIVFYVYPISYPCVEYQNLTHYCENIDISQFNDIICQVYDDCGKCYIYYTLNKTG